MTRVDRRTHSGPHTIDPAESPPSTARRPGIAPRTETAVAIIVVLPGVAALAFLGIAAAAVVPEDSVRESVDRRSEEARSTSSRSRHLPEKRKLSSICCIRCELPSTEKSS